MKNSPRQKSGNLNISTNKKINIPIRPDKGGFGGENGIKSLAGLSFFKWDLSRLTNKKRRCYVNKSFFSLFLIFFLVVVTTGCATLFKNKMTEVFFTSEPSNARIYIDGLPMGRTPAKVMVSDKNPMRIVFKKEGYEEKGRIIGTRVSKKWAVGSLLPIGWLGVIIDAFTGNWNVLNEKEIHEVLDPIR